MQKFTHRFLFLTAFIFIFGCSGAFAQQTISAEKQALIKELMEATGGQKTDNDMIETMIAFQEREIPKMISALIDGDKNLTLAEKNQMRQSAIEAAERITKRTRDFFVSLDMSRMIEEVSYPLYDKNFSEGEIRDLTAFYRTPTGQKIISVMPKLMMDAMVAFSEKLAPKMQEFLEQTAEEELAALKQKLQTGKGKKANRKS